MCGICGVTRIEGTASLERMSAAMRHRGPDDEGVFVDREAGVGLAARRLSIIDVEGGHQPLANEDGAVWAVLNGEIYNFRSLRALLERSGHRFSTQTDTEVLVHLYEDYGPELVHALEGMFAFAIWDARARLLVLARDRFGEKPLFYAVREGELTFASELSALEAGLGGHGELDPAAVDAYFTFGYVPGPGSIVRGIEQLAPGHLLSWEGSSASCETRCYWSPPGRSARDHVNVRELVAETRDALDAAVLSRLVADVPVGVFLSGGVDSTLVAALAARSVSSLKTFTIGYDAGSTGESEAARASARAIGADHEEVVLTAAEVAELAPASLARLDQPLADEAFVALRALAGVARSRITVAVGGEGADELFGGYPRYAWLARSARIPAWAKRGGRVFAGALSAAAPASSAVARLSTLVSSAPLLDRHMQWVTGGRLLHRHLLYGPRLRPVLASARPRETFASGDGGVEARFMRLDQRRWLPDDVLAKADRATMQASLELRTPYLSREVAELAASVPAAVHVRGSGKFLLREVLRSVLPDADHARPKVAFRTPTAEWLRGPLAEATASQFGASAVYTDGWFAQAEVERLFREHLTGRRDLSSALWPIFVLGTWLDARRSGVAR